MRVSGRVRYIDQSHHLLSLFRQTQGDPDYQMKTLKEMAEIIESRFSHDQMSGEELRAATTLRQMLAHHLGKSVPPDPWALAHLAVDWGQLELSFDLKAQFDRQKSKAAGKRSGESRRLKAETTWHPHALDLAKSIRAKTPAIAQRDLASEIQALWRQEGEQPKFDNVLLFVRASESSGTLPKRRV